LCYRLQTLAEGCMAQKMGFAPCCCTYKRSKKRVKMPRNYHFGDVKINFFLGRGHSPLPRTPPRRRIAPLSEILNTPLRDCNQMVQNLSDAKLCVLFLE